MEAARKAIALAEMEEVERAGKSATVSRDVGRVCVVGDFFGERQKRK